VTAPDDRQVLRRRLLAARGLASAAEEHTLAPEGALSATQRRMWFSQQLDPTGVVANLCMAFDIAGPLNIGALTVAFDAVVARHEALRTVYRSGPGGDPVHTPGPSPVLDVRTGPAEPVLDGLARSAFDLSAEPPLRAAVIATAPHTHTLVLVGHHIAFDNTAWELLFAELSTAYAGGDLGPPAPVAHHELVRQARHQSDPQYWAADLEFWRARVAPVEGHSNTAGPGGRRARPLPGLAARLAAFARTERTTAFQVGLAAFGALLGRLRHDAERIAIGSPALQRPEPEDRAVIGCFLNTLVLNVDLRGGPTFRELVGQIRDDARAAFAHQGAPFDLVVAAARPARHAGPAPLFEALFAVRSDLRPQLPGLTLSPRPIESGAAEVGLALSLVRDGDEFVAEVTHRFDAFSADEVDTLLDRFARLLDAALTDPDLPVTTLPLLVPGERERLLDLAPGPDPVAGPHTVTELFTAAVAADQEAIAVVAGGRSWTYHELDVESARLASRLAAQLRGPDRVVALALPREFLLVVAILAVLRSAAAYLLIDPAHPAERIRHLLGDARPDLLLTLSGTLPDDVIGTGTTIVHLDEPAVESLPVRVRVHPAQAACVIYTSGSTGRPKGIVLSHHNLAELVRDPLLWQGEHTAVLVHSSLTFDAFSHELWTPLLTGRTAVLARDRLLDVAEIGAAISRHQITSLWLTAALFTVVADETPEILRPLREVWTGGEVVPAAAVRRVQAACPDLVIMDGYGPTETTTFATAHRANRLEPDHPAVPIGRPLAGTWVYVLDPALQPVPVGVAGELYIAGTGLGRGYLGQAAMTAERFVANPFGRPGERMYRTGDRVRFNRHGELEFLGRTDDQVKIRGFRVELGEVRAVLTEHPDVSNAAVVARPDVHGTQHLVAYAVTRSDPVEIRAFLAGRLPEFMVPSAVVTVDTLPLTANGKVDHGALPAPRFEAATSPRMPDTPAERALASLFEEILGVSDVGVHDDFFEMGGHSLLATRLATRAGHILGTALHVRDVFARPTVAGLAELLDTDAVQTPPLGRDVAERLVLRAAARVLSDTVALETDLVAEADERLPMLAAALSAEVLRPVTDTDLHSHPTVEQLAELVREHQRIPAGEFIRPLKKTGSAPPLYLVHPAGGDTTDYSSLAANLDRDQPCYGLERIDDELNLASRASRYLPLLEPPVMLGGWSTGGLIAFEIARQLHASGTPVGPLVLFDTSLPPWRRTEQERRRATANRINTIANYLTGLYQRPLGLDLPQLAEANAQNQLALFTEAVHRSGLTDIASPGLVRTHLSLVEDLVATAHYQPGDEPYPGPVVLFRATNQQPWDTPEPDEEPDDPALGWRHHCPDLKIVPIPGNHFDVVEPRGAETIARHLATLRHS
jgi:amino acid adenylation domain-containing protein